MGRTQTVEQTGKLWKLMWLVSIVALIAGLVSLVPAINAGKEFEVWAVLSTAGGLIGLLIAKVGAWWFHA